MAESVERYFRVMTVRRHSKLGERRWCPAADIYRTAETWVVKVDLAGVRLEDIEIEIEDKTLRIAGIRRDTFYNESVSYHQLEITYSRFEKKLSFPCRIEGATIERDYRDGLLILYLRTLENCE